MSSLDINQAFTIVNRVLEPEKLNEVQKVVLRACWQGKTYQEIAADSGYDADYIRVVGSRLWQNLSLAFEAKISKNNFKSILKEQIDRKRFLTGSLEFPDGQVPQNSNFYIERPPCEAQAYEEILNPGALVVIRSPSNMGKTSLMLRILAHGRSQNCQTVSLNLQLAEAPVLSNLDKFLRWLMANITLQLGLVSEIDRYWDRDLGSKVSCTNYFQKHVLSQIDKSLILALDEVNHLFEYPELAWEFLPLLRFWHEEANNTELWQRLRIIVVHSTDIYIPLEIHQSPFNLGLPIVLPQFNFEQIEELARRHQFQLAPENLERDLTSLMAMVGGFPYLIRQALYALSTTEITMERLLAEAPTLSGIYRTHLQRHSTTLRQYPDLMDAFKQVIEADAPIQVASIIAHKLGSIGLIELTGNKVFPSCQLYRLYFRNYLEI